MAEIVGLAALSHSPFWDLSFDVEGAGRTFVDGVMAARERIAALAPDALVIFGPDHFRNFFYDVMPPFCVGVEQVNAFGDYDIPAGPLPVDQALGRAILSGVTEAGFDPAVSLMMGVDHGIVQPYDAVAPGRRIPVVPVMVNSGGAPRPSLSRCWAFGKAVGEAIRACDLKRRVAILASGGLSHWVRPMSEEDPQTAPDMRDYTINGRPRVVEYSAMRDESVRERARSGAVGKVNADWDRAFLAGLERDPASMAGLDPDRMEAEAGNGAHEVRCWLVAVAAWGRPLSTLAYEPVPKWSTGMGCILGTAA